MQIFKSVKITLKLKQQTKSPAKLPGFSYYSNRLLYLFKQIIFAFAKQDTSHRPVPEGKFSETIYKTSMHGKVM